MDLNSFPIEILEAVLNKLSGRNLQIARLVCKAWNKEIISHGSLGIKLNDHELRPISFFNRLNTPRSLRIFRLCGPNYEKLRKHTLSKIRILIFQSFHNTYSRINLKFFSTYCSSLTSLKIVKPTLAFYDMEDQIGANVEPYSILNNLTCLSLIQRDSYENYCNGNHVQAISKNIQFLLNCIGSTKLKLLNIQINSSYYDINCCEARLNYRFENFVLPEFICRQPNLEQLHLEIPGSMPNKMWLPAAATTKSFPTKLKIISFLNNGGDSLGMLFDSANQIILYPELLSWNFDYYNNYDDPSQLLFWKSLLMAQTQLASAYFVTFQHFGQAEHIPCVLLKNNLATLTQITLQAKLSGIIDGSVLKNSICLYKLCIWNNLQEESDDEVHNEDDCHFINVKQLPPSLRMINLKFISLASNELYDLAELKFLKSIRIITDYPYFRKLATIEDFEIILKKMLRQRSLQHLTLGVFNRVCPCSKYKLTNCEIMLANLGRWFDSVTRCLTIK